MNSSQCPYISGHRQSTQSSIYSFYSKDRIHSSTNRIRTHARLWRNSWTAAPHELWSII
jgi:hypothetical protein